ncbi:uncharacterized protein LOC123685740 isoform X2 [Harmonia axyridis]|uniref:uncharacterized protein LOC123685740 isoform X2 n=1 Tax=Harmonia axyridis TaxID=115357 RepID=UPI001E276356|nr:uncharacterized protein LOC123685740 isoform X2 [Harmonia axyridis]
MDFLKMTHHLLAIFLVVISIFDACSAQRKLPKHSVVSVDVKTAVHFDCPEEFGYYPHPDDCTQYYVCVFGGALLESCTGGLMYSQELQTCDWPRNVGCDGAEIAAAATTPSSPSNSRIKEDYTRTRYTPPPPPKPSALVISRGQPRQQQIYHNEEINLKQQQLYQESEEALPEAQEEESDRQQRFYRGQPSTIGQVQRDRDGLRQSNAIAYHTGQKEKIGVISFGIHQPQEHQRDLTDYLEILTTNKLTLTRRKKRQTGPSSFFSPNIGPPTSWSSIQTLNRPSYPPYQIRQPTGPDSSYRGFPTRHHPSRQTNYNNPKTHHPSRFLDVNQYNANYFTSNAQNQRNNYYYLQVEPKRIPTKAEVYEKPEKIKLKYIQPSGFKPLNNSVTEAITKGFDIQKSYTFPPQNFTLPHRQNDFEWKPQSDRNHSNAKFNATPFHLKNSNPAQSFPSKNNVNKFTTEEPTKQTKNYTYSTFSSPSITNNFVTTVTQRTITFETSNKSHPVTKVYANHNYDEKTEPSTTSGKTKQTTKPPMKLENYTTKPKLNQSTHERTKFAEVNAKSNNSTSKKATKYSSKYKEDLTAGKMIRKPSKQGSSTTVSTTSPKHTTTFAPSQTVVAKGYQKSTTETPTTRQPTRSRTRQTSTTTSSRGKHRQVTKNRNNTTTRAESTTAAPEPISITSRNFATTSQYSANAYQQYEPEYDDKTKYEYNSYNEPQPSAAPVSYRSRTAAPTYQQNDLPSPKRGNVIQNDYIRGGYQEQNLPEYHDVAYDNEEEDHNSYRQSNRQPIRKETNLIEDHPSTSKSKNRNAVSHTSSTSRYSTKKPVKTPTPTISYKQSTVPSRASSNATNENLQVYPKPSHYLVPGKSTLYTFPTESQSKNTQTDNSNPNETLEFVEIEESISVSSEPTNQLLSSTSRYITKKPPSKSTYQVSSTGTSFKHEDNIEAKHTLNNFSSFSTTPSTFSSKSSTYSSGNQNYALINPTTYSPPRFQSRNTPSRSQQKNDNIRSTTSRNRKQANSHSVQFRESTRNSNSKKANSVRFVQNFVPINPISINQELIPIDNQEPPEDELYSSTETSQMKTTSRYYFTPRKSTVPSTTIKDETTEEKVIELSTTTIANIVSSQKTEILNKPEPTIPVQDQQILEKLNRYINSSSINADFVPQNKVFKGTVEIPPLKSLITDSDTVKDEPDLQPTYKLKPFKLLTKTAPNKTDSSLITSTPRISRINPAFKFMMNSLRGTKGHNTKCKESQNCSDFKLRTTNRGRGSGHYTAGNAITNDVTVNTVTVNRGTPPSRSRPTLKPSTSIVSKAQEFVDIYRFPPRRPDPIYPQPQPDKTAAKCRKDVCLLPDCNCGGKDIPGDIPPDQLPQIVLLTFDDSVNDLNKGLYQDLFEKGRVNPNGCPISATFYVSHEWTDYSQVQNLYSDGHEIASHTISHSFGEQFSQKKWTREIAGQREILAAYGGVHLEDIRGMRAPFLSVGGNKMFKMLYDSNFTYDSSMPIYENKPPSWPYTLDYKLFHDCMIPPCPTRSYPGVWEVPMVMWQDLNGGRCSMGDACSNPADAEGVHKMIMKNFQRHYTTNRAPFGLFYHAAWFTQPHHKEGFINFLDNILAMRDVWVITNWQAVQWVRDPTPTSRLGSFKPFQCDFADRPKRCNNPKVCNLWHKSGVRYMRTCQPCPDIYPWTGNSGIRSSRIDNDIED